MSYWAIGCRIYMMYTNHLSFYSIHFFVIIQYIQYVVGRGGECTFGDYSLNISILVVFNGFIPIFMDSIDTVVVLPGEVHKCG